MAVLSKIRQRSLLVIVVVGLALFAFVLMDLIGNGTLGESGRYVGSVNGKDIATDQFQFKVAQQQEQNKNASNVMISNSIWGQEVKTALYEEQFEKLGLSAGKAQIAGVLESSGNTMFLNELGKFSQEKFNQYIETLKTQYPNNWSMILEDYETSLANFANEQTYNSLVKAGFNTTNFEGKVMYQAENNKVNFDYVVLPYSSINDDQVAVTDQDIIDYMSKRKNQFKGDASRDFDYILIENKASDADIKEIEENVSALLNEKTVYNEATKQNEVIAGFATNDKIEEFVNSNSDIPFNEKYVFAKNLPSIDPSQGNVTPLYKEDNFVKISRILDTRSIADSVKSSHIIIPYQGSMAANAETKLTKEQAKIQADSIFALVKNNDSKFIEIANEINTDGTKGNGGDIGWVMYSQITYEGFDKDFAEFIYFNPKGSIQVVNTKFGYHIIKITDTGSRATAYKLATIAQEIEASSSTNDKTFALSQKIEMDAQSKSLEEVAKTNNINIVPVNGITAIEENVQGIGNQRNIVQWAFDKNTKKGDVKRFDVPQGFVIAKLKNISDNGLVSIERARATVEPLIKNEKKAALLVSKFKGSTLEEIAKANNETIKSATALSLSNPMIQGLGQEAKVVGVALGQEANKVSGAIEGKNGVYAVKTLAVVKAPELPNYNTYTNRINTQVKSSVQNRILSTLTNKADIEDKRINLGF